MGIFENSVEDFGIVAFFKKNPALMTTFFKLHALLHHAATVGSLLRRAADQINEGAGGTMGGIQDRAAADIVGDHHFLTGAALVNLCTAARVVTDEIGEAVAVQKQKAAQYLAFTIKTIKDKDKLEQVRVSP